MNPLRLKEIHRQVIADAMLATQQQQRDNELRERDERQRLAQNPGFADPDLDASLADTFLSEPA
jgi:hypothetical protein